MKIIKLPSNHFQAVMSREDLRTIYDWWTYGYMAGALRSPISPLPGDKH